MIFQLCWVGHVGCAQGNWRVEPLRFVQGRKRIFDFSFACRLGRLAQSLFFFDEILWRRFVSVNERLYLLCGPIGRLSVGGGAALPNGA